VNRLLLPVLILLALAAAPFVGSGSAYALTLLSRAMILGIAAISLSLLVGGAGLASLGHAAMVGIGAYSVAALDAAGLTASGVVFPAAILAAGLFALLTGAVSLRTSGVHFIMITWHSARWPFSPPPRCRSWVATTATRCMPAPPGSAPTCCRTGWCCTSSASPC
jgi:ABC-type branched-subunit amino acid transport system permease subunit